jgi:hypothetical protein
MSEQTGGGGQARVEPVIDYSVRKLCVERYPNHPRGCPNWNKRPSCQPKAPLLPDIIDCARPIVVIWNRFPFGDHVEKMRKRHPSWSERQLANCLYWQGTARKQLRQRVENYRGCRPKERRDVVLYCPEACGVNVTETMRRVGVELEWPPRRWAYQVALLAARLGGDNHD